MNIVCAVIQAVLVFTGAKISRAVEFEVNLQSLGPKIHRDFFGHNLEFTRCVCVCVCVFVCLCVHAYRKMRRIVVIIIFPPSHT